MPVLHFSIPGEPTGKGRPRFVRVGHHAMRAFTPKKTKDYEAKVRMLAMSKRNATVLDGPVSVEIVAVFKRPKRLMRKKDPDGLLWYEGRVDLDNVVKAVNDGLQGQAFNNDRQVVDITAKAFYAEKDQNPRTVITVRPADNPPHQTRQDDEDMAPGPARARASSSSRTMDR